MMLVVVHSLLLLLPVASGWHPAEGGEVAAQPHTLPQMSSLLLLCNPKADVAARAISCRPTCLNDAQLCGQLRV
jgi:hypothetical protein